LNFINLLVICKFLIYIYFLYFIFDMLISGWIKTFQIIIIFAILGRVKGFDFIVILFLNILVLLNTLFVLRVLLILY
jgi:hypothetical protein